MRKKFLTIVLPPLRRMNTGLMPFFGKIVLSCKNARNPVYAVAGKIAPCKIAVLPVLSARVAGIYICIKTKIMFQNTLSLKEKDTHIKFALSSELKDKFDEVAKGVGVPTAALIRNLMASAVSAYEAKKEQTRQQQVKAMMKELPPHLQEQFRAINKALEDGESISIIG